MTSYESRRSGLDDFVAEKLESEDRYDVLAKLVDPSIRDRFTQRAKLDQMKYKLMILENKIRFVKELRDSTLNLRDSRCDIERELEARNYVKIEATGRHSVDGKMVSIFELVGNRLEQFLSSPRASYNYLFDMTIDSCKEIAKLEKTFILLGKEYELAKESAKLQFNAYLDENADALLKTATIGDLMG